MRTQALIIGGGVTGTGLARDLALRGIQCIVAEEGDINSGASGRNHGLLHSGARYVATDPDAARECHEENEILNKIAPHCIEKTGGLFVAVEGDDEKYAADFPDLCSKCGIPSKSLTPEQARELEPSLSSKVFAAYLVGDGSIDPFKLSLENMAHAQKLGASLLYHTKVTGFEKENNRIKSVHLVHTGTGQGTVIEPEQVINATGAWVAQVAAMAGIKIEMLYSKGTLLVTGHRISNRVINRLRSPGDGDILVPGGTVSLLGTTSVRVDSLEDLRPTVEEVDLIVDEGSRMIPTLRGIRYIRAYAGVRPLLKMDTKLDDRSVSRGFMLLDHKDSGLENFVTVPSGKLSTYRFMAEKTADRVCEKLGVSIPCLTRTEPLPSTPSGMWTEPALGPKRWGKGNREEPLLCECELIPKNAIANLVETIQEHHGTIDLNAIGLRSRVGKGACQGTFCGKRVLSFLQETGHLEGPEGLKSLGEFLEGRWKGERPVLWHSQIMQAELKEALYCGSFDLETQGRPRQS